MAPARSTQILRSVSGNVPVGVDMSESDNPLLRSSYVRRELRENVWTRFSQTFYMWGHV